jgi:hypothetical protein
MANRFGDLDYTGRASPIRVHQRDFSVPEARTFPKSFHCCDLQSEFRTEKFDILSILALLASRPLGERIHSTVLLSAHESLRLPVANTYENKTTANDRDRVNVRQQRRERWLPEYQVFGVGSGRNYDKQDLSG